MKKTLLKFSCLVAVFLLLSNFQVKGESLSVITKQPTNVTAYYNDLFTLSIQATGQNLEYQWEYTNDAGEWFDYYSSTADSTQTEAYVSFGPIQPKYRCRVSNAAGTLYSREVTVTAICPDIKIVKQPKNATVKEGQVAVYNMEFNINIPQFIAVSWYVNGNFVSSTPVKDKKATFQLPYISKEQNGAQVQAQITWSCASDYFDLQSSVTTLTVLANPDAPHITQQLPKETKAVSGTRVTLKIAASGKNLTYEWWALQGKYPYSNGQPYVKVGTGKSYTFTPIYTDCYHEDYYVYAVISNSAGSAKSIEATVTALSPAPIIKKQPKSITLKEGERAIFTASASGSQDFLEFNWYKNGTNIFKETKYEGASVTATSTFSFSATSADKDAKVYCKINSYSGGNHCVSISPVIKTNVVKVTFIQDGTERIEVTNNADAARISADLAAIASDIETKEDITAYPNPNNGKFSINFKDASAGRRLIVRDKMGRVLIDKQTNSTDNSIDLGNAPAGIYLIQISSAKGLLTKTIEVK